MRARAAGLAATTALVLAASTVGAAVGVQRAADPEPVRASCTAKPVVRTLADGRQRIRTVCTLPPAPVETVTETVTADPTTEPPVTEPPTTEPPTTGDKWPDATNTGPTGTLTPYDGPMTITADGTIIEDKVITGALGIKAANVTVRNSKIVGRIFIDEEDTTDSSFTLVDSLVDAGDRPGTAVGAVRFTVLRTEIRGGNRSSNCWKDCDIRDSYVHGQFSDPSGVWHESGIRMGARGKIVGNTIVCDAPDFPPDAGCSASLTGYGDFAPVQDMLIQGNYFPTTTGGYCAYGGSSRGKPYSDGARDIRFIDNTFVPRADTGQCGYYGDVTAFDPDAPGNVWSGNVMTDGSPVDY